MQTSELKKKAHPIVVLGCILYFLFLGGYFATIAWLGSCETYNPAKWCQMFRR